MRRETQNVLLILLGGALLKIAVNGDYLLYVKPAHQPWIIGAGSVTALLGVLALVRDVLRAWGRALTHEEHGHHHPARAAWLLAVPVLAVFFVPSSALGADSLTRSGPGTPAAVGSSGADATFSALPPGDVVPMSMMDFVIRAGPGGDGALNGRTVALSGFVVHTEGQPMLARMVIGCCAADAFGVRVRLIGGGADALADDTWIEVTGRVVPATATADNGYVPDLTVATLREIPQPHDPYEY